MVRKYKKKIRSTWSDGDMHLAVKKIQEGCACKSVAMEYGIPRSTLQKKIKQILEDPSKTDNLNHKATGFRSTFTAEQELALVRVIQELENKMIGLDAKDVRKLAFDYAEKLQIPHQFNHSTGEAGKDWLRSFMDRHALSHRKAEHTSSARINSFNRTAVSDFFTLLKNIMDQYKFTPDRIFNVDETGISIVPKSAPKIIATKGRRQVEGLTAGERGENVTAEISMSATGVFMPPMLIFPRVKENPELMYGAPPGAWAEYHKTGYMKTEIFTRWFKKFIEFSHASAENPVLLLLDGHVTHVKNLQVLELAKENGIVILCFPPHCTHKMQPLDVGFNGPLNICFGKEVTAFQRPGNRVTLKNLYYIFGKAFIQTAKMETAVNSFRRCGIVPYNSEIFESEFSKSKETVTASSNTQNEVSESELQIESNTQVIKDILVDTNKQSTPSKDFQSSHDLINNQDSQQFPSSTLMQNSTHIETENISIPLNYLIQEKPLINYLNSYLQNIEDVSSTRVDNSNQQLSNQDSASISVNVPAQVISKKGKKKGEAAIITSNEYIERLSAEKIKNIKKEKAEKPKKDELRKRKQPSVTSAPAAKVRKPLKDLNLVPVHSTESTSSVKLLATGSVGEQVSLGGEENIFIPEFILNSQTSFSNFQPIEICYVNEEIAKSLNLVV